MDINLNFILSIVGQFFISFQRKMHYIGFGRSPLEVGTLE
jgi:hypothetical protein